MAPAVPKSPMSDRQDELYHIHKQEGNKKYTTFTANSVYKLHTICYYFCAYKFCRISCSSVMINLGAEDVEMPLKPG